MKTKLLFFVACFIFAHSFNAQTVYTTIPDSNFEQALIDLGHDSDGIVNQQVLTSDISSLISLDVSSENIISLDGIEDFTSLTTLKCDNNQLTSLNVTNNLELEEFSCWNNQLTNIDVTKNTKLKMFFCGFNQLTELDVSLNIELENLHCLQNELTSLDVSNNVDLLELRCEYNQLANLDVSNSEVLLELSCDNNQLTSLNVAKNLELEEFSCWNNQLTNIDVTKNTKLKMFFCGLNQLTELDVSSNIELENLHCLQNELTSLDLSNNLALVDLRCDINQLTSLDVSNNVALLELSCEYNQLTSLDVSNNVALLEFRCDNNQLTSLNVANNLELEEFMCWNNELTNLDVTKNTKLKLFFCGFNQLTELDVSLNIELENLHCLQNELTSLDVSNNVALFELHCDNNQLTSLNLKNGNNSNIVSQGIRIQDNPNLFCVEVDDAEYSSNNWFNLDDQTLFSENSCDDSLASKYVIIATEKVELEDDTIVESGYVGVTDEDGEAEVDDDSHVIETVEASEIDLDNSSSIGTQVFAPADIELPEFIYNTLSNNSSPNVEVDQYETVTLSGSVYEEVEVKKYGKVIFTNPNVYIEDLDVDKYAIVEFEQCTNLYLQDKLKFNKYSNFNPTGYSVTVYVDDNVQIKKGVEISAFIYANDEKIKAKGKSYAPIYMSGLFIAERIKGDNYVTWNKDATLTPCDISGETVARIIEGKKKVKIDLNEQFEDKILMTEEFSVKTWPIPSSNNFNVLVNALNESEVVLINVYDINGRLIHNDSFNPGYQYNFGNNLQSGVYIVKIIQSSNIKTLRVLKN